MKNYLRPQSVALVALACGVGATLFSWLLIGRQVEIESQAEFANQARLAGNVIERRIQRYVDTSTPSMPWRTTNPTSRGSIFTTSLAAWTSGGGCRECRRSR